NTEIKVELNVDLSCQSCVDTVTKEIKDKLKNTKIIKSDLQDQKFILQGTDLTMDILDTIKNTGREVSICGISPIENNNNNNNKDNNIEESQQHIVDGAAVCSLGIIEGWEKGCGGSGGEGSKGVYGVVRLLKASKEKTLFEGRVTGLKPGKHSLVVHQFGNLTSGCDNVGEPYISNKQSNNIFSDNNNNSNIDTAKGNKCREIINKIIGTSLVKQDGKAEFRVLSEKYEFWDLIGRSIVLHSQDAKYADTHKESKPESDNILGERIACGVICRAALVGQNPKKICPCD
ncbi:hypothetical protein DICPUDRAFT_19840, partial [Dictyostelium purpureum]